MSNIDLKRCVRGCFLDSDTMTSEQRSLAESMIQSGPPITPRVTLALPDGAVWNEETKTVTLADVSVAIKVPSTMYMRAVSGPPDFSSDAPTR